MTPISELIVMIRRFLDGSDVSINLAKRIESAISDIFPEDDEVQDIAINMASYSPGGGDFMYSEEDLKPQLMRVLSRAKERECE